MAEGYNRAVLRSAIGKMCQTIGWQAVQCSALDTLTDVLQRYLYRMGNMSKGYSELAGRSVSGMDDMALVMDQMSVALGDLQSFAGEVESMTLESEIYDALQESRVKAFGSSRNVTTPDEQQQQQQQAEEDPGLMDYDSDQSDELLQHLPPMCSRTNTETLSLADDLAGITVTPSDQELQSGPPATPAIVAGPQAAALVAVPPPPALGRSISMPATASSIAAALDDALTMPAAVASQYLQEGFAGLHAPLPSDDGSSESKSRPRTPSDQTPGPGRTGISPSNTPTGSGSQTPIPKKGRGRPPGKTQKTLDRLAAQELERAAKRKAKEDAILNRERKQQAKAVSLALKAAVAAATGKSPAPLPAPAPALQSSGEWDIRNAEVTNSNGSVVEGIVPTQDEMSIAPSPTPNATSNPSTQSLQVVSKKRTHSQSQDGGKTDKKSAKKKKRKDKPAATEPSASPVIAVSVPTETATLVTSEGTKQPVVEVKQEKIVLAICSIPKAKTTVLPPSPSPLDCEQVAAARTMLSSASAVPPAEPVASSLAGDDSLIQGTKKRKKKKKHHHKHKESSSMSEKTPQKKDKHSASTKSGSKTQRTPTSSSSGSKEALATPKKTSSKDSSGTPVKGTPKEKELFSTPLKKVQSSPLSTMASASMSPLATPPAIAKASTPQTSANSTPKTSHAKKLLLSTPKQSQAKQSQAKQSLTKSSPTTPAKSGSPGSEKKKSSKHSSKKKASSSGGTPKVSIQVMDGGREDAKISIKITDSGKMDAKVAVSAPIAEVKAPPVAGGDGLRVDDRASVTDSSTARPDSKKKHKKKRKHEADDSTAADQPAKKKKKKKPSVPESTLVSIATTGTTVSMSSAGLSAAGKATVASSKSSLTSKARVPDIPNGSSVRKSPIAVAGAPKHSQPSVTSSDAVVSEGPGWPQPQTLSMVLKPMPKQEMAMDASAAPGPALAQSVSQAVSGAILPENPTVIAGAGEKLYLCPLCHKPDDGRLMITCDKCNNDEWYHSGCVGLQAPPTANEKWFCPPCQKKADKRAKKKKKEPSSSSQHRDSKPAPIKTKLLPLPSLSAAVVTKGADARTSPQLDKDVPGGAVLPSTPPLLQNYSHPPLPPEEKYTISKVAQVSPLPRKQVSPPPLKEEPMDTS